MRHCIVKNCPRSWLKTDSSPDREHTSFHKFPVNEELRAAWKNAIGLPQSWNPGAGALICSEHFKATDFFPVYASGYRKLRPNSVPGLYCLPWDIAKPLKNARRRKKATVQANISSPTAAPPGKPPKNGQSGSSPLLIPERPHEKKLQLTSAQLLNVLQSSSDEGWDSESDAEEQLQKQIEILTSKIVRRDAKSVNSVRRKIKVEDGCDCAMLDSPKITGKGQFTGKKDCKDSVSTDISSKYSKVAVDDTSTVEDGDVVPLNWEKFLGTVTNENGETIGSDVIIVDETSKCTEHIVLQEDDSISGESDVESGLSPERVSDAWSLSSNSSEPENYEMIELAKRSKSQNSEVLFYRSCSQLGISDVPSQDESVVEMVAVDSDADSKPCCSTSSCQRELKSSLTFTETFAGHRAPGEMEDNSRTQNTLSLNDDSDAESSKSGYDSTQEENTKSDYHIIDDRSLIYAMSRGAERNCVFKENSTISKGKSDSVDLEVLNGDGCSQKSVETDSDVFIETISPITSNKLKEGVSNVQCAKDVVSSVNSLQKFSIFQNLDNFEALDESSSVSGCSKLCVNQSKSSSEDQRVGSNASCSLQSRDSCVLLNSDASNSGTSHSFPDLGRLRPHKLKEKENTSEGDFAESKIPSNGNVLPSGGDMSRTNQPITDDVDSASPPAKRPNLTASRPVTSGLSPNSKPSSAFANQSVTTWKVQCIDGQEVIVLDITLPGTSLVA